MSTKTLLLAGLVLFLGAAGAQAQGPQPTSETVVGTTQDDDLDTRSERVAVVPDELAAPAGRDAVMRRIGRAVKRVCRFDEIGTLSERSAYEACRATSLAAAVAQLDVLVARNASGPVRVASVELP